jgi:molybdate transport system ATP-binding protein
MGIAVRYRLRQPIALDVDFQVRGFTALLGRSGAGKTSLLKALAGLLPAAGSPWGGLAPELRPVGYLPQGAALFPHLTALRNVAYSIRGADRLATAQALLDGLGLGDLAGRPAPKLSGGEAQRVALARALARQPELLLLDEPSAALDAVSRDEMLAWLIEITQARKMPALVATHDPAIASRAEWLVLLAEGQVIQEGKCREVFEQPVNEAAARLLGYENVFWHEGRCCAIRAGDILVAAEGMPITLRAVRQMGLDVRLEGSGLVVDVRGGRIEDFSAGETVFLKFPEGKVKNVLF